jgi:drug/metabolite transporter (DMT)-like permease
VGFVLTYLLLVPALRRHGVTVPTAAVQVSMVVPVVVSAVFWHERMGVAQALGLLIAVLAIALLAPPPQNGKTMLSSSAYLLVPGIFLLSAATRIAQKALTVLAPGTAQPALALIWFGAAALFSIGMMAVTGWPTRKGEWGAGVALGLVNLGSLAFTLRALSHLPATILFPALSCLALALTSAGGYVFWRERLTRRTTLGLVVGLAAVVLVGVR